MFDSFINPTESQRPRFITERNGIKVALPYNPNTPMNPTYESNKEFMLVYEEISSKGLVWLRPCELDEEADVTTKIGKKYIKDIIPYEMFQS